MSIFDLTRRIAVTALAAWVVLCCCDRRVVAEAVFGANPSSAGCCASDHRAATTARASANGASATTEGGNHAPCCAHCDGGASSDSGRSTDDDAPTDDPLPGDTPRPVDSHCCGSGCCDKSASVTTPFVPWVDLVGCALPTTLASRATPDALCAALEPLEPDDGGHPPPRLLLVRSARFRI